MSSTCVLSVTEPVLGLNSASFSRMVFNEILEGRVYMKKILIAAVAVAAAGALYAKPPAAPRPEAPAVKIEKLAAATAIADREPVAEAVVFPADTARIYIWTRISAKKAPFTIRHVYYYEGKKTAEAALTVNSTYYRVWSVKAVKPGSWKVDVTDEAGAVLASLDFAVTP